MANATNAGRGLHSKLVAVFERVLQRYLDRLEAHDRVNIADLDMDEIEASMLQDLFDENAIPSPAMLSAVRQFLKDNDIGFESEELNQLSDLERRLADQRKNRKPIGTLSLVENG